MVNQLLDLRMADFKKEPVKDATDIRDEYGPGPITSQRHSRPVSVCIEFSLCF